MSFEYEILCFIKNLFCYTTIVHTRKIKDFCNPLIESFTLTTLHGFSLNQMIMVMSLFKYTRCLHAHDLVTHIYSQTHPTVCKTTLYNSPVGNK